MVAVYFLLPSRVNEGGDDHCLSAIDLAPSIRGRGVEARMHRRTRTGTRISLGCRRTAATTGLFPQDCRQREAEGQPSVIWMVSIFGGSTGCEFSPPGPGRT